MSRDYTDPKELVKVAEAGGIAINYHPATKRFMATVKVKGREHNLYAPTQRALEKKVISLVDPDKRRKAIMCDTYDGAKKIELIRHIGDRGWEYIDEDGRSSNTRYERPYEWNEESYKMLRALVQEKDKFEKDWQARFDKEKSKLKPIQRVLETTK